jgi:hypothetical protein
MSKTKVESENSLNIENLDVSKINTNPVALTSVKGEFKAEISTNEQPIRWLADAIEDAILAATNFSAETGFEADENEEQEDKVTFDSISDMFVACFKVALGARLAAVADGKVTFSRRDFEYVSLVGPILAQYGVYENELEAYRIVPVWSESLLNDLKKLKAVNEKSVFVVPDWYKAAIRRLRAFGLHTSFGLPKDKLVPTPDMFLLSTDKAANPGVVGKPDASPQRVFIASLVSSAALTELFGQYRLYYGRISSIRSAVEDIGLKALHKLRET